MIAFCVTLQSGYVENDWIAGFQTVQHALEIRERRYGHAVDAIDNVAFGQRRRAGRLNTNLGDESVRIDVFDEKTLHAGQMTIRAQLRRQFGERDTEMQRVAARVVRFRTWFGWFVPVAES